MGNLDKTNCIPSYLSLDLTSSKKFYENSTTLLDNLHDFDQNLDKYIQDFIDFSNSKVSPKPIQEKINVLDRIYKKIDKLPNNIATFWYKTILNQIEQVKSAIIELNSKDFSEISDSIGSLSNGYIAYNDNSTPFHTYANDNIRPNFYVPGNIFNKIDKNVYANILYASKLTDAVFKHNLAPSSKEDTANLIQSPSVAAVETIDNIYSKPVCTSTHGDNLVTDVSGTISMNLIKVEIRKQIRLTYKKLYNIINALKSRSLINSTTVRTTTPITFESITKDQFADETQLWEKFDLMQQKIQDFDKEITIASQLG